MQQIFDFLNECRTQLKFPFYGLRKDAPTPKRKIVDDLVSWFTTGYNAALETDPESLSKHMKGVPYVERSVMLEGSYAAVASLDLTGGGKWNKLQELMVFATDNIVSINEGIGHALCQQRESIYFDPAMTKSFWGFLAIDGYGCHAGYFRWPSVIYRLEVPAGLDETGMHAFDQGLGRALWLIGAADPKTIAQLIARFPPSRRADLWSGVGMMIGFWGADDADDMRRLLAASGQWHAWFKLGVAWSVYGRVQASDVTDYTQEASSTICRANVAETASLTSTCLDEAKGEEADGESFQRWKILMAKEFAAV